MQNVTLIGIDLGKHSFHVHCQDKSGKTLLRKKFTRTKLIEFLSGSSSSTVVIEEPVLVPTLWLAGLLI